MFDYLHLQVIPGDHIAGFHDTHHSSINFEFALSNDAEMDGMGSQIGPARSKNKSFVLFFVDSVLLDLRFCRARRKDDLAFLVVDKFHTEGVIFAYLIFGINRVLNQNKESQFVFSIESQTKGGKFKADLE